MFLELKWKHQKIRNTQGTSFETKLTSTDYENSKISLTSHEVIRENIKIGKTGARHDSEEVILIYTESSKVPLIGAT